MIRPTHIPRWLHSGQSVLGRSRQALTLVVESARQLEVAAFGAHVLRAASGAGDQLAVGMELVGQSNGNQSATRSSGLPPWQHG